MTDEGEADVAELLETIRYHASGDCLHTASPADHIACFAVIEKAAITAAQFTREAGK